MKTSLTKLKSSLILLSLITTPLWSRPVAQVSDISGSVFVMTPKGETVLLKVNAHIEEKSEIMVEEGAHITLMDYYNATYHMIGGSHAKFFDKSVQLKRGKTWVQSQNSRFPLALTTANGNADFWKGEFIATFDQATSRSQFLVVNGDVEVSNVLDRNLKYLVSAGTFTLVDPEVENGVPRAPTKVGLTSLNAALAEFKQLPKAMNEQAPAPVERKIASVEEEEKAEVKKGEIIFISTNRLPASVGSAHHYYKKKTVKRTSKPVEVSAVPVRVYGLIPLTAPVATKKAEIKVEQRTPASIQPQAAQPKAMESQTTLNLDQEFAESLKKQAEEQPKYSKEVDSLIQDLKSY